MQKLLKVQIEACNRSLDELHQLLDGEASLFRKTMVRGSAVLGKVLHQLESLLDLKWVELTRGGDPNASPPPARRKKAAAEARAPPADQIA
jgi:hypothetical protein